MHERVRRCNLDYELFKKRLAIVGYHAFVLDDAVDAYRLFLKRLPIPRPDVEGIGPELDNGIC
jgi:hypothetical protein